jgi:hypothetical protein
MAKELDISIEGMLEKGLEALRREMSNLLSMSAQGKLAKEDGHHLVAYVKLLTDLQKKKAEDLSEMTDEDLAKAIKDIDDKSKTSR